MNQLKKKNQLNLNAIAGIEDLSDEMAATQCGGRKLVKFWTGFIGSDDGAWRRDSEIKKNEGYNFDGRFNDKLSSIEISSEAPDNFEITLYEDRNGKGKSWTLTGKDKGYDFRQKGNGNAAWTGRKAISATNDRKFFKTDVPNNKISSYKVSW